MAKQTNKTQTTKQPTLLKLLLLNIDNGIYPDDDMIDEIQTELGLKHLRDINKALLAQLRSGNNKTISNPEREQSGLSMVSPSKQGRKQPEVKKPKADPNKALTPNQLGRLNVINGR